MFFGAFVPPEVLIKHIEKEIYFAKEQIEMAEKNNKELDENYRDHPGYKYWKILSKRGELTTRAMLEWSNEAIAELKKIK